MSYPPRGGSNYGGQRRGSFGLGKRFGKGNQNKNFNRDFVGGEGMPTGSLRDYGYVATAPDEQRQQALLDCVKAEGFGATAGKLQVLIGLTGVPEVDSVIQLDLEWLHNGQPKLPT
jgi:hypothetical protein